ncbi:MAG: hypothetical protein ACM3UU_04615 [Ignavibacteriales bacterium]
MKKITILGLTLIMLFMAIGTVCASSGSTAIFTPVPQYIQYILIIGAIFIIAGLIVLFALININNVN